MVYLTQLHFGRKHEPGHVNSVREAISVQTLSGFSWSHYVDRVRTRSVGHMLGVLHLLAPPLHSPSFFALMVAQELSMDSLTKATLPVDFLVLSANGGHLQEVEGWEGGTTAPCTQSSDTFSSFAPMVLGVVRTSSICWFWTPQHPLLLPLNLLSHL